MVKHIVFWSFKDNANGMTKAEILKKVKHDLEALVGIVPGLLKAEVGIGFNPKGYDACLYSEFDSKESLEGYQDHPEHVKVREFITAVRTERAVCDYEA